MVGLEELVELWLTYGLVRLNTFLRNSELVKLSESTWLRNPLPLRLRFYVLPARITMMIALLLGSGPFTKERKSATMYMPITAIVPC